MKFEAKLIVMSFALFEVTITSVTNDLLPLKPLLVIL